MTIAMLVSQAFENAIDKEFLGCNFQTVYRSDKQIADDYAIIRSMFASSYRVNPDSWYIGCKNSVSLQLRLDRIVSVCDEMKRILCNSKP